jgi:GT2 family glycosyltransferase
MNAPEVAIVVVNWNGPSDTIACIHSLAASVHGGTIRLAIVDNASSDRSVSLISTELVSMGYVEQIEEALGDEFHHAGTLSIFTKANAALTEVALVANQNNLGFAAANNIGYASLKRRGDPAYVWYLNNDTVVEPETLSRLVARMIDDPSIGICGATLIYYGSPNVVQAYGGVNFSFATARGHRLGGGTTYCGPLVNALIEERLSYVSGASMLVSREFLRQIGPMCEDYFLYCEEVDWAWRARKHFRLGVETAALVYHKEGASIGTGSRTRRHSPLSAFFQTRNHLRFARRHTPWFVPSVWIALLIRAAKRAMHGEFASSFVMLSAMFGRQKPSKDWFRRV